MDALITSLGGINVNTLIDVHLQQTHHFFQKGTETKKLPKREMYKLPKDE